jgi:O-antigen ligase
MSSAPQDPTRLPLRVLLGAGLAGLVLLTLAESSATRMFATPWNGVLVAVVALPPLGLLLRLWVLSGTMKQPAFPWLLAAGLAGLGPTLSALASPYRAPSLLSAGLPLSAICLFLLVHDWLQADEAKRRAQLGRWLAGGAGLVALVSALYWVRDVADRLAAGRTVASLFDMRNPNPLGHSNYTAGLMLLGLPWLAVLVWRERGWVRTAAAGGGLLSLLNLFTCGSRGGLLGLAALGVAGVALARPGWRRILLFSGAALAASVLLAVANPRVRALLRPDDLATSPNASSVQRGAMLLAGRLMGTDRPLLGWGPGTTPLVYPRYRHALDGGAENVLQLHNTPLHLWAETGAVGLIGAGLLAALAALNRRRAPVAAATLAGYGVFALTDFQLDVPVFAASVAVLAALLAKPASGHTARSLRLFLGTGVAAAAGLIVVLGGRDPAPALNVEALRLARDPVQQARAVALFNESLALNPDQEIAHFSLGWLLLVPEPAKAETHFRAAARLVPDKGGVYFGLGLARLNQGDRTGAARAFALECVNEPLFLASPWWTVPEIGALRDDASIHFARLLDQAFPRNINIKISWSEKQARLMQTLSPRLGQSSPGPETSYRRTRLGYPVLMRNSDLAPAVDLYDVREDPRFPASVPFPLPPKGWLPSPLLLKLLDEAVPVRQ